MITLNANYHAETIKLKHVKQLYERVWSVESITSMHGYAPYSNLFEAFVNWLLLVLNPKVKYYVIMNNASGVCGTFKVTQHKSFVKIGYSVTPEHRGKGLIDLLIKRLQNSCGKMIYASVYAGNTYSERLLLRNGFKLLGIDITENQSVFWWR